MKTKREITRAVKKKIIKKKAARRKFLKKKVAIISSVIKKAAKLLRDDTKKKANIHLEYMEDVPPINSFTASENESRLIEAYDSNQSMPEFVLLSAEGNQIGPWMKCKDYIQDCIWGGMFAKSYNCHGFFYTHGADPMPDLNHLHVAMRFSAENAKLGEMLENVKKTVENLEERINIPTQERTKFSRIIGNSYFVVYGSKHWLKATHTISFFTFLLRASFKNTGGKIESIGETPPCKNDIYYLNSGKNYIEMFYKVGILNIKSNWPENGNHNDAYKIHNAGFVNWSSDHLGDAKLKAETDSDWEF
jgi:hypothetical protein